MATTKQSRTAAAKAKNAALKEENAALKHEVEELRKGLLKSLGKKTMKNSRKATEESGAKDMKSAVPAASAAITGEKAPAKKEPVVSTHYFEMDGEQISSAVMEGRIKEFLKSEGYNTDAIKTLDVYYNFPERRAYYVVNGEAEGKSVPF